MYLVKTKTYFQTYHDFFFSFSFQMKITIVSPDRHISLSTNHQPFLLNSIGYPNYKIGFLDCVWVATAPREDAKVIIKFRVLDFQHSMEALTIGIGDDSQDRLSIVFRSWEGDAASSPVFTGSQIAWIRYVTYWPYDKSTTGFLLEIWASPDTGRHYHDHDWMLFLLFLS